jgi:hypothetical protein
MTFPPDTPGVSGGNVMIVGRVSPFSLGVCAHEAG